MLRLPRPSKKSVQGWTPDRTLEPEQNGTARTKYDGIKEGEHDSGGHGGGLVAENVDSGKIKISGGRRGWPLATARWIGGV